MFAAVPCDREGRPAEALLQPRGDQPDDAGMPSLAAGDQQRRPLARSNFRIGFRNRLGNGSRLDRLALAVQPVEQSARSSPPPTGSVAVNSRAPSVASPIRPPALMRGPSRKPRCPQSGGLFRRDALMSARSPMRSVRRSATSPFYDERAVQAGQRNHVADGAERDEIERRKKIGKRARKIAPPKLAQQRHGGEECHANGGELTLRRDVVAAAWIDDREGRRQIRADLMMVEHDDIDAALLRTLQRARSWSSRNRRRRSASRRRR